VSSTKQVIVMRKDLKMRKGKMIAQGSHASMAFITRRLQTYDLGGGDLYTTMLKPVEQEWLRSSFKKIVVYVNSLEELEGLITACFDDHVEVQKITDNGDTEFGGVPTVTCIAIGPDYDEKIDPITGDLPLL